MNWIINTLALFYALRKLQGDQSEYGWQKRGSERSICGQPEDLLSIGLGLVDGVMERFVEASGWLKIAEGSSMSIQGGDFNIHLPVRARWKLLDCLRTRVEAQKDNFDALLISDGRLFIKEMKHIVSRVAVIKTSMKGVFLCLTPISESLQIDAGIELAMNIMSAKTKGRIVHNTCQIIFPEPRFADLGGKWSCDFERVRKTGQREIAEGRVSQISYSVDLQFSPVIENQAKIKMQTSQEKINRSFLFWLVAAGSALPIMVGACDRQCWILRI